MCERSFRHEVIHYPGGVDGFVAGTLPFIQRALATKEPILVAARADGGVALREQLGDAAARVHFADMRVLGRNPGRIISAWHDFLESHYGENSHALGIGEPVWPGRSAAELTECERHEALLNLAFDGGRAWHLLCPYDLDGLNDNVLEASQHTHPFVAGASDGDHNHLYTSEAAPNPFDGALPVPAAKVHEQSFAGSGALPDLRAFVSAWATQHTLETERADRLVLAVNEIATNSVRYGGGGGHLRVWRERDALLCEVRDAGHFQEPLVGRRRPAIEAYSGRGLWLAHQLCDLVQVRSSPTGSSVRLHMQLAT